MRHIRKEIFGGFGGIAHRDTQKNSPNQDADVVCIKQRINRVNYHVADEGGKYLGNFGGCGFVCSLNARKGELDGECIADCHCGEGGGKGANYVQHNDSLHGFRKLGVAQSIDNQEEYQERRNCLQGANEQGAKHFDNGEILGAKATKQSADNKADDNALDKAQARPCFCNFFHRCLLEWEDWG